MWKFLILVLLPVFASTDSFVSLPEDEIIANYKTARGLLTPEQEEFLMELLAADDALIEAQSRGIVDEILQALSGTGSGNIRVNIIGGSASQQQQQPAPPPLGISASVSVPVPSYNNQQQQQPIYQQPQPVYNQQQPQPVYNSQPQQQQPQAAQPALNIINPTITVVSTPNTQEKTLINSSDTTNTISSNSTSTNIAPMPQSDLSTSASGAAPPQVSTSSGSYYPGLPSSSGASSSVQSPSSGSSSSGSYYPGLPNNNNNNVNNAQYPYQGTGSNAVPQQMGNVTTIGGNNNHLFNTISQVIRNSNSRNVTGIVDESLRIATPAPIREFVTGILNVVYCNGIRRLLGRC